MKEILLSHHNGRILEPHDDSLWPQDGIIHVWLVDVRRLTESLPESGGSTSVDERARASRLRGANTKQTFIAGRTALRAILAAYLDRRAAEVEFTYNPHGKPALTGAAKVLQFNLSHSARYAVCAVARAKPVGVDIEAVRPVPGALGIARDVFQRAEYDELVALGPAARSKAFLTCWTRKEAVLKAEGRDAARSMRDPEVEFAPGVAPRLRSWQGSQRAAEGWSLRDLDLPPSYVGTLAVRGTVAAMCSVVFPTDCDADPARLKRVLSSQAADLSPV